MADEVKEIKLSYKQQAFVNEYLVDFNATRAAKKAGYSDKWTHTNANKLLQNTTIAALIKSELDARAMSAEEALDIITQHAKGDIGEFMSVGSMGFSLDLEEAHRIGKTRLIKKIKQKTTIFSGKKEEDDREVHEIEIELYDAQAAADKILRVAGKYKSAENDAGNFTIVIRREDK